MAKSALRTVIWHTSGLGNQEVGGLLAACGWLGFVFMELLALRILCMDLELIAFKLSVLLDLVPHELGATRVAMASCTANALIVIFSTLWLKAQSVYDTLSVHTILFQRRPNRAGL